MLSSHSADTIVQALYLKNCQEKQQLETMIPALSFLDEKLSITYFFHSPKDQMAIVGQVRAGIGKSIWVSKVRGLGGKDSSPWALFRYFL